jgi:hypothetical protein
MALAFARLAAIAAATLLFLGAVEEVGVEAIGLMASGLGHAFSSCFFDEESSLLITKAPLSGQIELKVQKDALAFSRTVAFASPSPFWIDFSRVSRPPLASMAALDREPWISRNVLV